MNTLTPLPLQLRQDIHESNVAIAEIRNREAKETVVIADTGEIHGMQREFVRKMRDTLMLTSEEITEHSPAALRERLSALQDFYVHCGLKPTEVEPIDSLVEEFTKTRNNGAYSRCTVLRNRGILREGKIVSSLHRTYHPRSQSAFIKFQATDPAHRGGGRSQLLLAKGMKDGGKINTIGAEAVDRSEHYWNNLQLSEDGIGLRRAYVMLDDKNFKEVEYRLPDLRPDLETGEDTSGGPIKEHFMMTKREIKADDPRVTSEDFGKLVSRLYASWYSVDRGDTRFTEKARERRNDNVMQIFTEMHNQVALSAKAIYLISGELRKALKNLGYGFEEHDTAA